MANPIIIYGPTATGKTELAINIAKKINGEIISADSRQVYKRLDIGSGKISFSSDITKSEGYWIVNGIKISGFDLVNPEEKFTAADFLKFAQKAIGKIQKEGKIPIVVGGTAFYINSLIKGLGSLGVAPYPELRAKLAKFSTEELFVKLQGINEKKAKLMNQSDRKNPHRLIRAIEISLSPPTVPVESKLTKYLLIGLTADNDLLYKNADIALENRLKSGVIYEIQELLESKVSAIWLESLGLDYRWITRFLKIRLTKDEALERLRGDLHDFIRRQKTWFSKFPEILIFDISQTGWKEKVENKISRDPEN